MLKQSGTITKKMHRLVLACDPGKNNHAWTILTDTGELLNFGLVKETFMDLTSKEGIVKGVDILHAEIDIINNLTNKANVAVVYERFIPRGMMWGNIAEIVNMNIGIFLSKLDYTTVLPVTASSWKKYAKKHWKDVNNPTIPIHNLDAYRMGLYFLIKNKKITDDDAVNLITYMEKNNYGWECKNNTWKKKG